MRIYILVASVAALAACGGGTAPVSAGVVDASSDVAIDHISGQGGPSGVMPSPSGSATAPGKGAAVKHPSPGSLGVNPAGGGSSSSGGSTDAGSGSDASMQSASFACGSVMCMAPGQYCSVTMTQFGSNTSYTCSQTPFACSSGPNCGCVDTFDGGTGCTCSNTGGHVTLTCPY